MPAILLLIVVLTVANVEATESTLSSVPSSPCPSRKLTITVDSKMRLYIDGTKKSGLANAKNWKKADTVELSCTARVIAVRGTDCGNIAGILASTDDGLIMTDSLWKCTNVFYKGWQLVGYDDSSWPSAYVIAIHQTSPWKLVPGIRTDAYWIWTPKYKGGDLVVYCRKDIESVDLPPISSSPVPSYKLSITCDNIMRLYIDGIEQTGLANANDWTKADTVDLPWTASVVAVQGTNLGDVGGILASTDDFTVVNNPELWKCTNVYHDGWQLVDFDDSSWPSAYAIGVHQTCPWTLIPGIKRNVYWIWTYKYNGGDLVVYCRINSVSSIPPSGLPCQWRHLTITTENIMRLYVDGYENSVADGPNCMGVETIEISWIARVIAVKVNDVSVVAGILVSTDDGFVLTDSWWKCTNVYYEGWGSWTFDDSSWPWASVNGVHQTFPTTPVQGIGTDPTTPVQGIGTDPAWMSTTTGDSGVYCRRLLDDSRGC